MPVRLLLNFAALLLGPATFAQSSTCTPSWLPTFGGVAGSGSIVSAMQAFDDGNGEALYATGVFATAAGSVVSTAKWDGSRWSPLGEGVDSVAASAFAVFDDGNGDALYVGGSFASVEGVAANNIAKWDGTSWTALGSGVAGGISALTVGDLGSGPRLYVGGTFGTAGGIVVRGIARWNGSLWQQLGSGVTGGSPGTSSVFGLAMFDDGNEVRLFAGGNFDAAGGIPARNIAQWSGTSWVPVSQGVSQGPLFRSVDALLAADDVAGAPLFVGGMFTSASGVPASRIAKWNGSHWAALGSGVSGAFPLTTVNALAVFHDGGGPTIVAGGNFTTSLDSGDSFVARWGCSSMIASDSCNGDGGDHSAVRIVPAATTRPSARLAVA